MRFRFGYLLGFGSGYYLGAKAGRARYEQLSDMLDRVRRSDAYETTAEKARSIVDEQVERVKEVVEPRIEQAREVVEERVGRAKEVVEEQQGTNGQQAGPDSAGETRSDLPPGPPPAGSLSDLPPVPPPTKPLPDDRPLGGPPA
ncbi:MAG TPA: hypothetical protein VGV63_03400 [Acidimicrobiales bacterium]|nr:hypothetical protein [Acidimicrobiales bacterium]